MMRLFAIAVAITGFLLAPAQADVKTPAAREALFEDIVAKTMAREAWSPIKNRVYGVSYPEAFEPFRQLFIDADTDEALYYAIVQLSNARNDRHLSVARVEGGLDFPSRPRLLAPIAFLPDFSDDRASFFVSGLGGDLSVIEGGRRLSLGDRLLEINGVPIEDYIETVRPYHRASTEANFLMRAAMALNENSGLLPQAFYGERFIVKLKPRRGRAYTVSAPYLDPHEAGVRSGWEQRYPGFEKVLEFTSFDFYRRKDNRKIVLFDWYGFRDDIVMAMDAVIDYAAAEGLLDHDVIWDGTQSRGGGRGAYAIQRLQSKPFKTTFGNLRLSDVAPAFIDERVNMYRSRQQMSDGALETVDDGKWLVDWLTGDVTEGLKTGQDYSNDVPFKLAHAPEFSDGVLYPPALRHFTGELVCWLGPRGGSHLDQFAAIVVDNGLCPTLGMPAGGYSNTWEWEETLTWPGTDEPVVRYMWSIGHTIRPNGEILEGNPASVDEFIPLTAENFQSYYDILLQRSYELLGQ